MNPLYRIQMKCLLRFWPMALPLAAIPFLISTQDPRIILLCLFLGCFWAPVARRETEYMAALAPLSRSRKIRANLMFTGTMALFIGSYAGLSTVPPASLETVFLPIHVANLSLTVLIGALGGEMLDSHSSGLPREERFTLLILASLPYGGLGILQAVSPGLPWLWIVLLLILLPLLFLYLDFLRKIEMVPSKSIRRPGSPKTRKRAFPVQRSLKRPASPPRGCRPGVLFRKMSGQDRLPYILVLLILALIPDFLSAGLSAGLSSAVIFWGLRSYSFSFLSTPFSRRRAFVLLHAPLAVLWMVWGAIHMSLWLFGSDPFELLLHCLFFLLMVPFVEILGIPPPWASGSRFRRGAIWFLVFGVLITFTIPLGDPELATNLNGFFARQPLAFLILPLALILVVRRNYGAFRQLTLDGQLR